jgi:hypothetical protein
MESRTLRIIVGSCIAFGIACGGCGSNKDYYYTEEKGPHGIVGVKKVYYTPEQLAAREAAREAQREEVREAVRQEMKQEAAASNGSADPDLTTIQQNWPKLTAEQRATVLRTVKQMAGTE